LHYACLLEKPKHAEALLEFGANPFAVNEFGLTPLQLLPNDAVRSVKIQFKKVFDVRFILIQPVRLHILQLLHSIGSTSEAEVTVNRFCFARSIVNKIYSEYFVFLHLDI